MRLACKCHWPIRVHSRVFAVSILFEKCFREQTVRVVDSFVLCVFEVNLFITNCNIRLATDPRGHFRFAFVSLGPLSLEQCDLTDQEIDIDRFH